MIQTYLTNSKIALGTKKSTLDSHKIETLLRDDFPELAWVSVEITGTRLIVHLKERIIHVSALERKEPCNIVAQKDATILSIITRNGTPLVKTGDKVKAGDILISGAVNLTDDNNEITETDYVNADGDIYAHTVENYKNQFPMDYYEKVYLKKRIAYFSIRIGNKVFAPYKGTFKENEEDISITHNMRIGDTFYLPFSFTTHYAYEYTLTHKKHDKNTAKAKAKRMMKNLNAKYLEKGVEIVENNVKIMIDKNTCTLKGTLILKEPFGKLSPIEKISEPNMNSEEDSNARNNSKHESQ